MVWLLVGIVWWSTVHLMVSVAPGARQWLVDRLGENPYKGLFTLDLVLALGLMIYGWRTTAPVAVYAPAGFAYVVSFPLMFIAMFLFVSAARRSAVKRFLRHPQLTGLTVWSVTHLLSNGDQRTLLLFGGLGLWAVAEMVFINRRDGEWIKPEAVPLGNDLVGAAIAAALMVVLVFVHPYMAGVALVTY